MNNDLNDYIAAISTCACLPTRGVLLPAVTADMCNSVKGRGVRIYRCKPTQSRPLQTTTFCRRSTRSLSAANLALSIVPGQTPQAVSCLWGYRCRMADVEDIAISDVPHIVPRFKCEAFIQYKSLCCAARCRGRDHLYAMVAGVVEAV